MNLLKRYRTWRDNPERKWRFVHELKHTHTSWEGTSADFTAELWNDDEFGDGILLATGKGSSMNCARADALRQARASTPAGDGDES